jgi:hypothetical protein
LRSGTMCQGTRSRSPFPVNTGPEGPCLRRADRGRSTRKQECRSGVRVASKAATARMANTLGQQLLRRASLSALWISPVMRRSRRGSWAGTSDVGCRVSASKLIEKVLSRPTHAIIGFHVA